jgi:peptide-methionine (S)-S-oxide reductase
VKRRTKFNNLKLKNNSTLSLFRNFNLLNMNSGNSSEVVTLGNGCFWCTEAVYSQLNGVLSVTSGYSGGITENPDYNSVCSGTTQHAECVQIEYDPAIIRFEELLEVFWTTHDPTSLNRQGEDVGTQYRSVIFYRSEQEKETSQQYINQLNASGVYASPIVTTLEPFTQFYSAEDYHQQYFAYNTQNPYCQFVVRPKVEKFKKRFADRLKSN